MTHILYGKAVSEAIDAKSQEQSQKLLNLGLKPTIAIVSVGQRQDDIVYANQIIKKAQMLNVAVKVFNYPNEILAAQFYQNLKEINADEHINGVLILKPLASHIDTVVANNLISQSKDIEGCSNGNLLALINKQEKYYAPATAQAVIEMLDFYHIEIPGKNCVVVGRSIVIGKPLSFLLLNRDATVTICHSKSNDLAKITTSGDIVIAAIGKSRMLSTPYFSSNQTVIDVGINVDQDNNICGDVDFDKVNGLVANISPVPKGIGSITVSILLARAIEACAQQDLR